MKREIKFRGKDLNTGKWVYGYFVKHLPYTPSAIMTEEEAEKIKGDYEYYILKDAFSDWNMPRNTEHVQVNPETVGQFTGLLDKHGADIYEGDIILIHNPTTRPEPYKCEVYFNLNIAAFEGKTDELTYELFLNGNNVDKNKPEILKLYRTLEIIATIHDQEASDE